MMGPFFTADLHFGHENIIKFAKRPFADAYEMDEALIANWNATVDHFDHIFIIGDFSFHQASITKKILTRLNGNKYLIRGNHDLKRIKDDLKKRFIWVKDQHLIKVPDLDVMGGNQLIFLNHYAMRVWDRKHYGAWNLHGHSHGTLPILPGYKQLDVGVDAWGYKPVSYNTIKKIMADFEDKPVDHHKESYGE